MEKKDNRGKDKELNALLKVINKNYNILTTNIDLWGFANNKENMIKVAELCEDCFREIRKIMEYS